MTIRRTNTGFLVIEHGDNHMRYMYHSKRYAIKLFREKFNLKYVRVKIIDLT